MEKFSQGDSVRVKKPKKTKAKRFGQSKSPDSIVVTLDGESVRLKHGLVLRVSSYTDAKIVSLDSNPMPLIQTDFINRNKQTNKLFELVEAAEKD